MKNFMNSLCAEFDVTKLGPSEVYGNLYVVLNSPQQLRQMVTFLLNNGYPTLQVVSAVDWPEKNQIELVYIFASFCTEQTTHDDLLIKVYLNRENAEIDTLCDLIEASDFLERECFDMMGVVFKGHPNLTRILTSEDWEGYPLRKDYVPAETWRGIRLNPPEKTNQADREFSKLQRKDPHLSRPQW